MLGFRTKQRAENGLALAMTNAPAGTSAETGFDAAFYLTAYSDVRAAGVDPEAHYHTSGWREGRNPSREFDTVFYRLTASGLSHPDENPLAHFSHTGSAFGHATTRSSALKNGVVDRPAEAILLALPELAEMVDADFYEGRYPDVAGSGLTAAAHYVAFGWRENRLPSPAFDTGFYRKQFQHMDAADICPAEHFLRYGRKAGLPTTQSEARTRGRAIRAGQGDVALTALVNLDRETVAVLAAPHFSASFYLKQNPDVAAAGVDAFWHYIGNGWIEGRAPAPGFDNKWYAANHMVGLVAICPLLHYATVGRVMDLPTSIVSEFEKMERVADAQMGDWLRDFMTKLGFDASVLADHHVRRLMVPMFSADTYRGLHGLGPDVSDSEAFLRYLAFDFPAGMAPGPIFSADHYLAECARLGLPRPGPADPVFHHWLQHGAAAGVSPCPAFRPEDYLSANPDLASYPGMLFSHYLLHGIGERRAFSRLTSVATSYLAPLVGHKTPRARKFLEQAGATAHLPGGLAEMQAFASSDQLEETIRAAAAIDPNVGSIDASVSSMIPPWHDEGWAEYEAVLKLLPTGPIGAIVLMPFCKLGGADFVAGVLTTTLQTRGRTVVIRTDAGDWARPDWFPEGIETVDLSPLLGKMNQPTRMQMLYEALVRMRPGSVYNVNSRLAFDTFERYGQRLALLSKLHAYYFCADRTPEGIEAGYPVWYFSNILPHLTVAMIDNAVLAQQLIARFSLTGAYRDKVQVIYTPAMSDPPALPMASQQLARAGKRGRQRVLWAGRLDAQKRFDLVASIATLLPGVDFDCWGKAVLDAPPDLSALPTNMRLHDPFKSYAELPLADADCWLYTSSWDGIPTILIELAAMGLPLVSSAVGGVPELLDDTTGWPLTETATAEDYANAIKAMLSDPLARVTRATALQARVRDRHDRAIYAQAVLGEMVEAGG